MAEIQEFESVLAAVRNLPEMQQVSLARMILQTVEPAQSAQVTTGVSKRRGKPVERLIGLGAGDGRPPTDETVAIDLQDTNATRQSLRSLPSAVICRELMARPWRRNIALLS